MSLHQLENDFLKTCNADLDGEHEYWNSLLTDSNWTERDASEKEPVSRFRKWRDSQPKWSSWDHHMSKQWTRPVITTDNVARDASKDDMRFMVMDIDYITTTMKEVRTKKVFPKDDILPYEKMPVFRIYGIDEDGCDVMAHVHGYLPYFYVDCGLLNILKEPNGKVVDVLIDRLKERLNELLSKNKNTKGKSGEDPYVHSIEVVHKFLCNGYQTEKKPFFKITLLSPSYIVTLRDLFEKNYFAIDKYGGCKHTLESNIPYIIRYMTQLKMIGNGWVRVAAGDYTLRSCLKEPQKMMGRSLLPMDLNEEKNLIKDDAKGEVNGLERISYCNTELDLHFTRLEILDHHEKPWDKHAQYVNVSYDIEVINSTKQFPDPYNPLDRIISVAPYVTVTGGVPEGENPIKFVGVFGLDTSASVDPLDKEDKEILQRKITKIKGDLENLLKGKEKEEKIKNMEKELKETQKKLEWHINNPEPVPVIYTHCKENISDDPDVVERTLILTFARWMRSIRPDMVTGWNIDRFDGYYLYHRARYLGIEDKLNFGRIIGDRTRLRKMTFQNNAMGKTEYNILSMPGVDMDAYTIAKKDVSMTDIRFYSLKNVAQKILKSSKKDMPYDKIAPTFKRDEKGRATVHEYCIQDARLVWKIMDQMGWHYSYIEQARAAGVPLQYLSFRGVQIRILAKQLQDIHQREYIVPYLRDDINRVFMRGKYATKRTKMKHGVAWDDRSEQATTTRKRKNAGDGQAQKRVKGYDGATVIDPKKGYHEDYVVIIDFNSLYPNEMRQHNISFDTVILDPIKRMEMRQGYDYWVAPNGAAFVLPHIHEGSLPRILNELLTLRSKAKNEMKKYAPGSPEWSVYNGRQMGLKVTANSVYGASGTLLGTLVNLDVAAAVTSSGRADLFRTVELVHNISKRRKEFGYCKDKEGNLLYDKEGNPLWKFPYPMEVIYGDTDSVFVLFHGCQDSGDAFRVGKETEKICNLYFQEPMALDAENICKGIILFKKKRYATFASERPDIPFKLYVKGLEYKRRDNAGFVKKMWEEILTLLLWEKKPKEALKRANDILKDIIDGNVNRSLYVISQALTRNPEEYASKPAHVLVAEKMYERNPNNAPEAGDRVEYVILKGKSPKVSERAEDPVYAEQHNLPIDTKYYGMKQVVEPLIRLFMPMMEFQMIQKDRLVPVTETISDEFNPVRKKPRTTKRKNAFDCLMSSKARLPISTVKEATNYLFGKTLARANQRTFTVSTNPAFFSKKKSLIASYFPVKTEPKEEEEDDHIEYKPVYIKQESDNKDSVEEERVWGDFF